MSIPYASSPQDPGCIYKPDIPGLKSRQFEPIGAFIVIVFGPLFGGVNVYGIRKELLAVDNADSLWIEFAPSDEIVSGNQSAIFDTPANLLCEVRFDNADEEVFVYWDYGTQLTLDRKER